MVAEIQNGELGSSVRGKLNALIATGLVATDTKTGAYSAAVGDLIYTDSSASAFTVTLPASPSHGDEIGVFDVADAWSTNNVTVARNGQLIEEAATDLVLDGGRLCLLRYVSGVGWKIAMLLATATPSASDITVTPAGGIASTNAQAAFEELDSEKAAIGHQHTLADISDSGTAAASDVGDFATAAQGATADSAVQPDGTSLLSADAGNDLTVNPKFWVGTQAEYDAIGTPDANTIYNIVA